MIGSILKSFLKQIHCYYPLLHTKRKMSEIWLRYIYSKRFPPVENGTLICNACLHRFHQMVDWFPAPENVSALSNNQVVAGYGKNIICPVCLSTARERLVIEILKQENNWSDKTVLIIAPEQKVWQFLQQSADVITADLIPQLYRHIDPTIKKEDLNHLSFEADYFDLVIANHVLEHIPDDRKAMKEIFRVLKKNGQAILQVPYSNVLATTIEEPGIQDPVRQSALFGQCDHVRIYSMTDYINRLEQAGFTVKKIDAQTLKQLYPTALQEGEDFLWIIK